MCEHLKCTKCIHCVRCDGWAGTVVPAPHGKPCKAHLHCGLCGAQQRTYLAEDGWLAAVHCENCGHVQLFEAESPWLRGLKCTTEFPAC